MTRSSPVKMGQLWQVLVFNLSDSKIYIYSGFAHCGPMVINDDIDWANIASGNGLLLEDIKVLPEINLTYWWLSLTFTWEQFQNKRSTIFLFSDIQNIIHVRKMFINAGPLIQMIFVWRAHVIPITNQKIYKCALQQICLTRHWQIFIHVTDVFLCSGVIFP